jgi:quercetin dioxygenase-like cupin family protein
MEFDVAGERFVVGPGEVLAIPADARHTARIVGDEVVLNVDGLAPVREDYLHLVERDGAGFG